MSFLSFFERVCEKTQGNVNYEAYAAKHARSTMILYSKQTRTPLAALVLSSPHAADPNVGVQALFTARAPPTNESESAYFQGMLNVPDQQFNFSICNLTKDYINFNILHTPHRVNEVDPGPSYGINQVNELKEDQVYTIPVDQRTGKTMILSGLKSSGDGTAVSVKDDEAKGNQKSGLYFYLSVVPQIKSKIVDFFKEGTEWECALGFVRKSNIAPSSLWRSSRASAARGEYSARGEYLDEIDFGVSRGSRASAAIACAFHRADNTYPHLREESHLNLSENFYCEAPAPNLLMNQEYDSLNMGQASTSGALVRQTFNEIDSISTQSPKRKSKSAFESVDVGTTQAGTLKYGESIIEKVSHTNIEYDYTQASASTVVCLSIYPGMKFFPLPNMKELLQEEIDECIKNGGKTLLATVKKVFISDMCVIDLESPADTIIIQCGHQCVNHANTQSLNNKCPMCRKPIMALVKAEGEIVA